MSATHSLGPTSFANSMETAESSTRVSLSPTEPYPHTQLYVFVSRRGRGSRRCSVDGPPGSCRRGREALPSCWLGAAVQSATPACSERVRAIGPREQDVAGVRGDPASQG